MKNLLFFLIFSSFILACPTGFYATTVPTCAPNPTFKPTPTPTPSPTPTASPTASVNPVMNLTCTEICGKSCYCDYIVKTPYCRTDAEMKNTMNWNYFSQHFQVAGWCLQDKFSGNKFNAWSHDKTDKNCGIVANLTLWGSTKIPLIRCCNGTKEDYNLFHFYYSYWKNNGYYACPNH